MIYAMFKKNNLLEAQPGKYILWIKSKLVGILSVQAKQKTVYDEMSVVFRHWATPSVQWSGFPLHFHKQWLISVQAFFPKAWPRMSPNMTHNKCKTEVRRDPAMQRFKSITVCLICKSGKLRKICFLRFFLFYEGILFWVYKT